MHLLSWRRLFLYSRRQKRPEAALIHQGHQIACSILSWDADMLFWQLFTSQTPNTSLFPKRPHYSTLYWWCHAAGGQRTDMNKHPKSDRDAMRIPRPDISIRTLGSGIMNMCCFFFLFFSLQSAWQCAFHHPPPKSHSALPVSGDLRVTLISGTVFQPIF